MEGVKGVVVVSLAEADERDAERVPTCASGKIVTPPATRPMAAATTPTQLRIVCKPSRSTVIRHYSDDIRTRWISLHRTIQYTLCGRDTTPRLMHTYTAIFDC